MSTSTEIDRVIKGFYCISLHFPQMNVTGSYGQQINIDPVMAWSRQSLPEPVLIQINDSL